MCGLPFSEFPAARPLATPGSHLCGGCRHHPLPFDYARAGARYGDVTRAALHALKFAGRRAMAAPLGDLLAEMGVDSLPVAAPDLLVPVPLHRRRQRERGFNQALLLARRLGRAWGVPVRPDVLARVVETRPQTEVAPDARRSNVRGAFTLRRPELVAGRHVIIIDDIFTTGSTATACALAVKDGGAAVVGVLTVARAL